MSGPLRVINLAYGEVLLVRDETECVCGRRAVVSDPWIPRRVWITRPCPHKGGVNTLDEVLQSGTTHNVTDNGGNNKIDDLIAYSLTLPVGN